MRKQALVLAGALLCCACAASAQTGTVSAKLYAIRAARLFDSATGAITQPGLVVVSDGKIQSIGGTAPANATVIDLGDATLLPGFIDAHTHLSMEFNADYNGASLLGLQRPVSEASIRAIANARKTLMAGFTTVRDVGGSDFIDVGLRNTTASFRVRACWYLSTRSAPRAAIAMTKRASALASSITNPDRRMA
jgi:imidazolonepropionase-like amidohydrolase